MASDDRGEKGADESAIAPSGVAHRRRRPVDIKSLALTGLFVLAVFYTMYFMRAMLLPLVLALLLSYLLVPLVRGLAKLRIPPLLGAALVLLALIGTIGYGVSRLSEPVGSRRRPTACSSSRESCSRSRSRWRKWRKPPVKSTN